MGGPVDPKIDESVGHFLIRPLLKPLTLYQVIGTSEAKGRAVQRNKALREQLNLSKFRSV